MKLKNRILSILLAAITVIGLSSCASTNPDGTKQPVDYIPYVKSAAVVATNAVLDKATSEADKQAKAAVLVRIANQVALITSDSATGADIAKIVTEIGGTKPHWQLLALSLAIAYDTNSPKIPYRTLINTLATEIRETATLSL